jgi:competence protein ComFB
MELHNYMEDAVRENLERLLSERDDICKCEKCKLDIMALVLNKLPSKYVVTLKGRVYTKLSQLELQRKADIVKELTKAIEIVKNNPQH